MSISGLGVAALGNLEDVLLRQGRSIGAIIPSVVIEEQHTDDLMITQHPVEDGADITDHAVKQPSQVTMHCGFSNSGSNTPLLGVFQPTPRDAYNSLLALQESRVPFDVVTGKRSYKNMLIKRLTVITDLETENVLMVDVELQEILIVDTSGTSSNSVTSGPSQLFQADPAQTSGITNLGQQQLTNVTSSLSTSQISSISNLVH